jgi:hypothetical protein
MQINKIPRPPVGADTSVLGAIKWPSLSPLQFPPIVTPPRSEGSLALGREMLRCTQHDSAVPPTGVQNILSMSIIGPYRCLVYFVKLHYRAHRRIYRPPVHLSIS